jgi:CO/xanthine dehydrogenase Mo-binding subunit
VIPRARTRPRAGGCAPRGGTVRLDVAVDPGTGNVELLDCLVVEDVGRIDNPLTLHGEAIGGMVQGLGVTPAQTYIPPIARR